MVGVMVIDLSAAFDTPFCWRNSSCMDDRQPSMQRFSVEFLKGPSWIHYCTYCLPMSFQMSYMMNMMNPSLPYHLSCTAHPVTALSTMQTMQLTALIARALWYSPTLSLSQSYTIYVYCTIFSCNKSVNHLITEANKLYITLL